MHIPFNSDLAAQMGIVRTVLTGVKEVSEYKHDLGGERHENCSVAQAQKVLWSL